MTAEEEVEVEEEEEDQGERKCSMDEEEHVISKGLKRTGKLEHCFRSMFLLPSLASKSQ